MNLPPAPPRALRNVILVGATLRLVGLGTHSLWLDEGATWSWATRSTWAGTVFAEANHPPAWWVLTRLWVASFGDSEAALRAPAAILSCVAIYLAWLLGLRLLDPAHAPRRGGFPAEEDGGRGWRTAAWFAAFVAGSAFLVEYAQEARMYSLLLVETLGLALLYLRWLDRGDRLSLAGYALLAALALHTHYFALLPVLSHAGHALWLAWRTRGGAAAVRPLPFLLAAAAAGVLFLPWFLYLVTHYERIATGRPYEPFGRLLYVLWRMGAGPGLVVVDRDRLAEGQEAVIAEEWPAVALVAAAWLLPFALGCAALPRLRGAGSFLAASLLVPVGFLLAAFPWFPLIHERYLMFLAPVVYLVATLGAFRAGLWGRPIALAAMALLLAVGFAAYFGPSPRLVAEGARPVLDGRTLASSYGPDPEDPLRVVHRGHPYGKEPWRYAHRFVDELAREGDLVVLAPPYLELVWDYYDRRRRERLLFPKEGMPAEEIERVHGDALRGRRRVFLVLAHEETEDPDACFLALRSALASLWLPQRPPHFTALPPILFRRSWGVRVAVFDRGGP